jgi:mannose-6-phosphate isomerase-like protein (cupin superfamily)
MYGNGLMRVCVVSVMGLGLAMLDTLAAQQPAPRSTSGEITFASGADVAAALAKAKSGLRQGQAMTTTRLIQAAPYVMDLEYRGAAPQPAVLRENKAVMVYVMEGSATTVTGGKLVNESRTNAEVHTGTAVEGGKTRHVGPGDQFFVAENTPYWFSSVDGSIALLSLQVPRPVRPCCVYLGQMGWVPGGAKMDTTFISGADVEALLAKVKAARKDDQALASSPIVQLLPYTSHIEYRQMGPEATRMLWHGSEAELFIVMDGSATMVTGGKMLDETPTEGDGRRGTAGEGARSRRLMKGDIVFVPERTPHGFSAFYPWIVLRSLHVPRGATF